MERHELIEERLRLDPEPGARHLAHLAGERQMVEVLPDGHRDGEVDRVASARDELRRPERRLDASAAAAAVLLAAMANDPVAALDEIDLLALLALISHLGERAAAGDAGAVRVVERVHDLDERKRGLDARAVAPTRGSRRLRGLGVRGGRAALLGGATEELLLHARELGAQAFELELERGLCVAALRLGERLHECGEAAMEVIVLLLLQARHLAQHFGARLGGEIDHGGMLH